MIRSRRLVPAALIAPIALILWLVFSGHRTPAGQAPLTSLTPDTLQQIRDEFNEHSNATRVVLLLSPT
jgi:hypothetical protein